jgi:hypothetical protein
MLCYNNICRHFAFLYNINVLEYLDGKNKSKNIVKEISSYLISLFLFKFHYIYETNWQIYLYGGGVRFFLSPAPY